MKTNLNYRFWFQACLILCASVVFSLRVVSLYQFIPVHDDLIYHKKLLESGVFKILWQEYLTWDGRFLSISAFVELMVLKYLNSGLGVAFWFVLRTMSWFVLLRAFNLKIFESFLYALLTDGLLILFCPTYFPQITYWITGGAYTMSIFFGSLLVYFFRKGKSLYSKVLFGFLFIWSNTPLAIGLGTCALVWLVWNDKAYRFRDIALVVLAVLLPLLIFTHPPLTRATEEMVFNPFDIMWNAQGVFRRFLSYNVGFIISGFLLGFLSNLNVKITGRIELYFTIAALFSSVVIFSVYPYSSYPRTSLIFGFLIFLISIWLGSMLRLLVSVNKKILILFRTSCLIIITGGLVVKGASYVQEQREYVTQIDQLYENLSICEEEKVIIDCNPPLRTNPFVFYRSDCPDWYLDQLQKTFDCDIVLSR